MFLQRCYLTTQALTLIVRQKHPLHRLPAAQLHSASEHNPISAFEVSPSGKTKLTAKTVENLTDLKSELKLPLRDLRMFFRPRHLIRQSLPVILVRPSSECFLVSLRHIQLLCRTDRCLILHPDDPAVREFVGDLQKHIKLANEEQPFEQLVLETALNTMVSKFRRNLNLLKPIVELLLQEMSANPDAVMLRRLLGFRKALNSFEMTVQTVRSAVKDILETEVDLKGLSLNLGTARFYLVHPQNEST